MPDYRIAVVGLDQVRPTDVARDAVRAALEPLVQRAGRTLDLFTPRLREQAVDHAANLQLTVDMTRRALGGQFTGPGRTPVCGQQGTLIFGNAGGGSIFAGRLLELRVAGAPQRGALSAVNPHHPLERRQLPAVTNYALRVEAVFHQGEDAFARAVANIIVHEIGHMLGLGHHSDPTNAMHTGASLCALHGAEWFNRHNLRAYYGGPRHFDEAQQRTLALSIRTSRTDTMSTFQPPAPGGGMPGTP